MFDFANLDSIDDDGAVPEWLKWQLQPAARGRPRGPLVDLQEVREEQFAPPEEEYVYEKLAVPLLPEEGAFDPMGLFYDAPDAVEDQLAAHNGQVILNFVSSSYEQHMLAEYQRQERKAYIEAVHSERLAVSAATASRTKQDKMIARDASKGFDRKAFSWREIQTPMIGQFVGVPDGGTYAECAFGSASKLLKYITRVRGTCFVPPAVMVQVLCSIAHFVRPQPTGPRITRNSPWHLALTDVFFPSPFVVDDGAEYIGKKEEAPTFVHMVAMSVNKETGEIEAKHLLESIRFQGSSKYPKRAAMSGRG